MAFEAKRIRVQLPCGEATVHEAPAAARRQIGTQTQTIAPGTLCRIPSVACNFPTAPCQDFGSLCGGFASPCQAFASPCQFFASGCNAFASPCQAFGSPCPLNSCGFNSPCGIQSACGLQSIPTITECGISEEPIEPGTIVVQPEHLPALREQLEAQLKEVELAQQALEEREG